jgi:ABC-type Zn uptake system ZnuABC Zn-binding protein ZnuA
MSHMARRFIAVHLILILILGAACLGGSGCGRSKAHSDDPVQVLATVYAIADIAKQVGGDYVTAEWYVEDGQSLTELSETPQRRQQFRAAELVVTRGAPDEWTMEGAGDPYQDRKILRVDTLPSTRDGDPLQYQWLDPRAAIELADEIATRLSALRPRHEKQFKANAAAFDRKVADMMEQTTTTMNRTIGGGGAMLTLDRGFIPLGRRFGLEEVRFNAIPPSQASDYYTRFLREKAREAGAGVIFLNAEAPTPQVRDWQNRLRMPVLTLDCMGSSSPVGHNSYLAVLKYNLAQLQIAAAKARPTTATTRYLAETADPTEYQPAAPASKPVADEDLAPPPLPVPANSSAIKVQPIPNPLEGLAQPTTPATTRPTASGPPPRVLLPAPTTPQQPAPAPRGPGIRVAPVHPSVSPGYQPSSRPHPSTLPSLDNPFGR